MGKTRVFPFNSERFQSLCISRPATWGVITLTVREAVKTGKLVCFRSNPSNSEYSASFVLLFHVADVAARKTSIYILLLSDRLQPIGRLCQEGCGIGAGLSHLDSKFLAFLFSRTSYVPTSVRSVKIWVEGAAALAEARDSTPTLALPLRGREQLRDPAPSEEDILHGKLGICRRAHR